MSRLHLQYLIVCAMSTLMASLVVAVFFIALNRRFTGLALVTGYITNLAVAAAVAIMAGRRVSNAYKLEDARLGSVAGLWMGVWVGLGALLGMALLAIALGWLFAALGVPSEIRAGLVGTFGVVSALVCMFASRIAGREAAHPPEEEEAA